MGSLAGQPFLLKKRERGSGERSYIRLSLWNICGTIEPDVVDHKVRIYVAYFCSNLRGLIACVPAKFRMYMIPTLGSKDGSSKQFLLSLLCG